jgi:N-acetylglucosamine-6-sulfatase
MKRLASLALVSLTLTVLVPTQDSPGQAVGTPRNVVLIFTDDQTYESLPVMRKLLAFPEGGWINFTNAYISASVCCPSRATVLTGQYSHNTGVIDNSTGNSLDDTNTLPVWLDRAGYRTGLIGKYLNGYPWTRGTGYVPPGWDYFNVGGTVGNADRRTDAAISFINGTAAGEPYFLHLSYKDPHNPAKPLTRYANANVYVPPDPPNLNEADVSDKPRWCAIWPPQPVHDRQLAQ